MKFTEWVKMKEMGSGPYIGDCKGGPDFQVFGACSDQKKRKKKKRFSEYVDINENKWKNMAMYGLGAAALGSTLAMSKIKKQQTQENPTEIVQLGSEVQSPSFYEDIISHQGKQNGYDLFTCFTDNNNLAIQSAKWYYAKYLARNKNIAWDNYKFEVETEQDHGYIVVKLKANGDSK